LVGEDQHGGGGDDGGGGGVYVFSVALSVSLKYLLLDQGTKKATNARTAVSARVTQNSILMSIRTILELK